jgi:hypothetical protein
MAEGEPDRIAFLFIFPQIKEIKGKKSIQQPQKERQVLEGEWNVLGNRFNGLAQTPKSKGRTDGFEEGPQMGRQGQQPNLAKFCGRKDVLTSMSIDFPLFCCL